MKRFGSLLAVLACLIVPLTASAQYPSSASARLTPLPLRFMTTSSSGVLNPVWLKNASHIDSTVFRKGSLTITSRFDTTAAYAFNRFPFPPNIAQSGYLPSAVGDSIQPWFFLRVHQDSTTGNFALPCGLDSVRAAVEVSNDRVNWYSCSGTPTYRFDTVFMTSGQDGLQNPTVIGVELLGFSDDVLIPFKVGLIASNGATALIANKLLYGQYDYFRLIIGGDYIGQFAAEILRWDATGPNGQDND